ncbi:MAG: hypothetical protein ACNA8W_20670 [Bradymonadaceae bacterium]
MTRYSILLAALFLIACGDGTEGTEANRDNGTPGSGGGEHAEWSLITSPCEDTHEVALFPRDATAWIAGCPGMIRTQNPRGLGLYRTTDGGTTWSSVGGWEEATVHDMALLPDGSTLVLSGTRLRRAGEEITSVEILWSADINDASLAPTVLYEVVPPSVRGDSTSLAITADGTIYVQDQNAADFLVGTIGGAFERVASGGIAKRLTALGDEVAAFPGGERGTTDLDILLENRGGDDPLLERLTIYNDPEATMSAGTALSYADGMAYAAGFKMPGMIPLVLANDGDLYDPSSWEELTLPLNDGIGPGVAITSRAGVKVLIGVSGTTSTTSWVAISRDDWSTIEFFNRLNMPDMARNLGDGDVELKHLRLLDDGTILVWGRDGASNSQSGGYIAHFGK